MSTGERVSVQDLRGVDIFAGLPEDDLKQIARVCSQRIYQAGEYCTMEGEITDELRVVNGGKVAIEMRIDVVPYTQTLTVTTLGRGKVCAWSALVEPHVLTASIKCVEKAHIISVKASDLRKLFKETSQVEAIIMENLASVISTRLRDSRAQLLRFIAEMVKQGKY